MAKGGHGLSKLSLGPAMPDQSTPCRQANPETALRLFQEWPARRAGGLQPSLMPLDTPRLTPMYYRRRSSEYRRRPSSSFLFHRIGPNPIRSSSFHWHSFPFLPKRLLDSSVDKRTSGSSHNNQPLLSFRFPSILHQINSKKLSDRKKDLHLNFTLKQKVAAMIRQTLNG
jgi:hypothetical protein